MMRALLAHSGLLAACIVACTAQTASGQPEETVVSADQVLHEVMSIPARQIPESLLEDAQGVAIIPGVIKVGFIAGIRRGHGVVVVRDAQGQWGLPQFVTLTGGSVGWQAGVQGTDVVLVFMTQKSIEGLLAGKFTIGADAAAAAGPVGRNAAVATDMRLKAEILSYSRSRGLFAGLALDGSAIEIDGPAHVAFYGSAPGHPPVRIPEPAARLRADLANLTSRQALVPAVGGPAPAAGVPTPAAAPAVPPDAATLMALRKSLAKNATDLQSIVDDSWQKYLALPAEVFEGKDAPSVGSLARSLRQYDQVASSPKYKQLTTRREFQSTYQLLREYSQSLAESSGSQVSLPPPPQR